MRIVLTPFVCNAQDLKLGIIGLDRVTGSVVVAAFQGSSPTVAENAGRVERFTQEGSVGRPQEQICTETSLQRTDANSVLFYVRKYFTGYVAGLLEILREIDRVRANYPPFVEDAFVRSHLDRLAQDEF